MNFCQEGQQSFCMHARDCCCWRRNASNGMDRDDTGDDRLHNHRHRDRSNSLIEKMNSMLVY